MSEFATGIVNDLFARLDDLAAEEGVYDNLSQLTDTRLAYIMLDDDEPYHDECLVAAADRTCWKDLYMLAKLAANTPRLHYVYDVIYHGMACMLMDEED